MIFTLSKNVLNYVFPMEVISLPRGQKLTLGETVEKNLKYYIHNIQL